jgi:hypothetical protein
VEDAVAPEPAAGVAVPLLPVDGVDEAEAEGAVLALAEADGLGVLLETEEPLGVADGSVDPVLPLEGVADPEPPRTAVCDGLWLETPSEEPEPPVLPQTVVPTVCPVANSVIAIGVIASTNTRLLTRA